MQKLDFGFEYLKYLRFLAHLIKFWLSVHPQWKNPILICIIIICIIVKIVTNLRGPKKIKICCGPGLQEVSASGLKKVPNLPSLIVTYDQYFFWKSCSSATQPEKLYWILLLILAFMVNVLWHKKCFLFAQT